MRHVPLNVRRVTLKTDARLGNVMMVGMLQATAA